MNTLIALLQLVPTIITTAINSVHAIETGFQDVATATGSTAAATGAHKAAVAEAALESVLSSAEAVAAGISSGTVTKVFATVRDAVVKAFNAIGLFKTTTPAK